MGAAAPISAVNQAHGDMNLALWRRLIPVAILLLGLALFLLLDCKRFVSFEMLSRHHVTLVAWVTQNPLQAGLLYLLTYAMVVAFSLPVAVLLTPIGGYLFGVWLGATLSVIGATLGSVVLFLAARSALHDIFHRRAGAMLARLEAGFRRDSFNYLLFLRLVPIFPFWLVNIVPALLGMKLDRYTLATAIGIVPGAVVYSGVGAGFGTVIDRGEVPDLSVIFQPRILLPLLGLAALSLVPVLYAQLKGRREN